MNKTLIKVTETDKNCSTVFIVSQTDGLKDFEFSLPEIEYINQKIKDSKSLVHINKYSHIQFVEQINSKNSDNKEAERLRNEAPKIWKTLADEKTDSLCIIDLVDKPTLTLALVEGLILTSYQFAKYKTVDADKQTSLQTIKIVSPTINQGHLDELNNVLDAVKITRDLVNETPEYLTSEKLASEAALHASKYGFSINILHKKEIENLKMGGLLSVNRGSVDPPTFSILEWKPETPINQKPIVLIGKGIVYDTGGINLKTAPGGLDDMKCDMSGAASVIGTLIAIAANKLQVHVIGLIPSTDNRPGFNAYVPGDVITMHSGLTVEVMNTDAEGRLILADALSYAKKYDPELTIDLATLTGSAVMAIGSFGTVAMGTANEDTCNQLSKHGFETGEKMAWFPFWDEYDDLIKSEVADMKNIGGREAGAITAGKFLSRFAPDNWIHLDIAGPAFLTKPIGYRGIGATGVGVRLLYNYLKSLSK